MVNFDKPISFDRLIREISSRYHLGPKGSSLVEEALETITGQSGGVTAFLDRFKDAGFAAEVASWSEGDDPLPLKGQQVEAALGSDALGAIAKKAGVSRRFTGTILGFAIPKIINKLAKAGALDVTLPTGLVQGDEVQQLAHERVTLRQLAGAVAPRFGRMLLPGAAVLIGLGVLGYVGLSSWRGHRAETTASTLPTAQPAPAAIPQAPSKPALVVTGTASEAIPPASSKPAPVAAQPPPAAIPPASSKPAPVAARPVPAVSQQAPPKPAPVAASRSSAIESGGDKEPASALARLRLELPTIYFAKNSAELPLNSKAQLQHLAVLMKQLPTGTLVRINGFADPNGNSSANMKLSQRRANAVRQVLVDAGADPGVLVAKGYGIDQLVDSESGATEGRSNAVIEGHPRANRRVEIHIARQ